MKIDVGNDKAAGNQHDRQPRQRKAMAVPDQRAAALAQHNFQQVANSSPQATQLRQQATLMAAAPSSLTSRQLRAIADGSPAVSQQAGIVQRKSVVGPTAQVDVKDPSTGVTTQQDVQSSITHTEGVIKLPAANVADAEEAEVGVKMSATLYPASTIKGTPVSSEQWEWLDKLKQKSKATVIRGHLLNHDLGGEGKSHNLFPISNAANSTHSGKVEEAVKGLLYGAESMAIPAHLPLQYNVSVDCPVKGSADKAKFVCDWSRNGQSYAYTVESDLGSKAYGDRMRRDNTGRPVARVVAPDGWAKGAKESPVNVAARNITAVTAGGAPGKVAKARDVVGIVHDTSFQATPNWITTFNSAIAVLYGSSTADQIRLTAAAKKLWDDCKNTSASMEEVESIADEIVSAWKVESPQQNFKTIKSADGRLKRTRLPDPGFDGRIIIAAEAVLAKIKADILSELGINLP